MANLGDIALVTQVAVFHNKQAFDQLVRKYQSPVRRFFLNQTLGDEQLSDDLAQETFIKAYVNITKFRGPWSGFESVLPSRNVGVVRGLSWGRCRGCR